MTGRRDQREFRMNYLASQILLQRNDPGEAETVIRMNLEGLREQPAKKREGGFLRLLGEFQFRRGEMDNAINSLKDAIRFLEEVENPRQLWQGNDSLASGLGDHKRMSDARGHWRAAANVIQNTANSLSDRALRVGFLEASAIREILSKSEI